LATSSPPLTTHARNGQPKQRATIAT
jgi:hypothetical protein